MRAPAAPAHRSFAALRHPGFRPYFVGSAMAMAADNIEHVISYWIMYEKFHSPTLGGIAVVTHWLPFLLFAVYSGALADRFDPRRLIQIAMGMFMGVSIAWSVLFMTGVAEIWHAVVLLTIHGLAGVLWQPAAQLLIHDIVGSEHLQSAVRLNATGRYIGLLVGPALGAGLMLVLGPSVGLFVNAAIYLPLLLWLGFTAYGAREARANRPIRTDDLVAAFRVARGNATIFAMTALAGAASLFIGSGYHAQMPGFAQDLGQHSADFRYSVLLAADAAGALLAGLLLEGRGLLASNARTATVLAGIWCVALGSFALTASYPFAIALLFVAGFVELSFSSMAQTLVQLNAPAEFRGRIVGLFNMSALGLRTFSGVTIGLAGGLFGIHASLAVSAAAMLAVSLALLSVAPKAVAIVRRS
ncbi:MAG: MFS transporter [Rhodospirillaceae bacterium]|nr:MFS transporter [Rhodospirillaceae bacterium]